MAEKSVKDIMHKGVIACKPDIPPDAPVSEAVKLMLENNVHRLLVTEMPPEGKKPVGIISTTDIVNDMRGRRWVWYMG